MPLHPLTPAEAARQLTLPATLAAALVAFLILQARMDARDPRLAQAPIDGDDQLSFT